MDTIKALLIDLDGVIRLWDARQTAQAEREAGLPAGALLRTAFATDLLHPAITGRITDDVWRQQVIERLQRKYPACQAMEAVRQWSEPAGEINRGVLELVRASRSKAAIVLVTNATSRLRHDLRRLSLDGEFDHIINSSTVGYIKPQAEIFHTALQAADIAPQQALFVDDQPANAEAARQLGMQEHVFTTVALLHEELKRHQLV